MPISGSGAGYRVHRRTKEPTLGLGWAYFVDNGSYSDFIKSYVDQDEVHILQRVYSLRETMTRHFADSDCVGFQALLNMLTKKSKGLCATGMAAVSCARHQLFRPLGMGDLQKGRTASNSTLCPLLIMLTSRTQAM